MKTFTYKGFDRGGASTRGLVEAMDLKEARERLAVRGILVQRISAAAGTRSRSGSWRRTRVFPADVRALVYEELAALLKAGMPVASALEMLVESPELGPHRTVLAGIRDRIRDGAAFTEALREESPDLWPVEEAALAVGDRSGNLAEALKRTGQYLEEQRALKDRIVGSLTYPAIVFVMVVLVAVGMFGFLLPKLEAMLSENRMEIPAVTRWTLAAGSAAGWIAGLGALLLVLFGVLLALRVRRFPEAREALHRRLLSIPVLRTPYTALVNLRFARTLAILLDGGVSLLEALPLAGASSGNAWVAKRVEEEAEQVRHGDRLADALARIRAFRGGLPGWVRAGELSGSLAEVLEQAAGRCQRQWERSVSRLVGLLEPLLILVVGALVFLLALSVILPILSMNRALH